MVLAVFKRVFRHNRYRLIVLVVALVVLSSALLLPNFSLIKQILLSANINFAAKFLVVFNLLGSISTNFTVLSASYLVIVSLLFGLNIALLTFYIRRRQEVTHSKKIHLSSIGGFVASLLGIGCAACGSVVLTAIFGLSGAAGFLVMLPFHGLEFGIIGLLLLLFSIYYLIKRIDDPLICPAKL